MEPHLKRFYEKYGPIQDAIAKLDIDQEVREHVADALAEAIGLNRKLTDFKPELFRLLASDPLCLCAGDGESECPDQTYIRIAMHLSEAPDGRSEAWAEFKPKVQCVSCGARARMRDGGP